MIWSRLFAVIFSSALVYEVSCSGYMEIRLKSEYRQQATIVISQGSNSTILALPTVLQAGNVRKLGKFPIEFTDTYTLSIIGGRVEQLGINGSTHTAPFTPSRGILSPKQLHLPLNGLELIFECDKNWRGSKCDTSCFFSCKAGSENKNMKIETDYSVDLTKLPELVKRLKDSTKVDNEIRTIENMDDGEENYEGSPLTKTTKPRKSVFQDLFKSIMALQDEIVHGKRERESSPLAIGISFNDDYDSKSSWEDSDTKKKEDDSMNPMNLVKSILMDKSAELDRKQEALTESKDSQRPQWSSESIKYTKDDSSNPMSFIQKMLMSKSKESDEKEEDYDVTTQKSILRHNKPSRFAVDDGPGIGAGMDVSKLFGPLMSMASPFPFPFGRK